LSATVSEHPRGGTGTSRSSSRGPTLNCGTVERWRWTSVSACGATPWWPRTRPWPATWPPQPQARCLGGKVDLNRAILDTVPAEPASSPPPVPGAALDPGGPRGLVPVARAPLGSGKYEPSCPLRSHLLLCHCGPIDDGTPTRRTSSPPAQPRQTPLPHVGANPPEHRPTRAPPHQSTARPTRRNGEVEALGKYSLANCGGEALLTPRAHDCHRDPPPASRHLPAGDSTA